MLMFRKLFSLVLLGAALALAGCSSNKPAKVTSGKNRFGESLAGFEGKGSPYYRGNGKIPRGGGKYHLGKPYQVAGKWFHPKEQPGYDRKGAASWYGEAFHRRKTSNGEYFDMNMLSAAHPHFAIAELCPRHQPGQWQANSCSHQRPRTLRGNAHY